MDGSLSNISEQQGSFGIKKIIDCKIEDDGRQVYKVKWEPTWELAENLPHCQHLIDEFWSLVNDAKKREDVAQQYRKRRRLDPSTTNVINIDCDTDFDQITEDDKAEVKSLIAQTNATSVGLPPSPSEQQHNFGVSVDYKENSGTFENKAGILDPIINSSMKPKLDELSLDRGKKDQLSTPSSSNSKTSNAASLKYIENFSNPYVKAIIVCKICNKESSKFTYVWRLHYLTHVSSEERPHECSLCHQRFITKDAVRKHRKAKHSGVTNDVSVIKGEKPFVDDLSIIN